MTLGKKIIKELNPLKRKQNTCRTIKFKHEGHKNKIKATTLSSHIWNLKDKNVVFDLKFSILNLSRSYCKDTKDFYIS